MNGLNVLKAKAKSIMAIFLCLSLILGEMVLFSMKSQAESTSGVEPLLDISVGEEFIIENGGTSIRQFPMLHGFGDDVFVTFSQATDTQWVTDGAMRISRDGGTTWPTYIHKDNFYFTSLIKLSSGTLFGVSYVSYLIDERHATVEYSTSSDNGETWTQHTGTIEFPQDIKDIAGNSGWSSFLFHRTMMEMPDGSIQGLMYGGYVGDSDYRTIWVKSTDGGENWTVVSNVAVPTGTGPSVYCEPVVARCSDGSLLCVMRTGNAPLYQCRSTDNGLTWSTPEMIPGVSESEAYSVDPHLYLMSNGVLVLSYGRPHCKMLFSADGTGRNWKHLTLTYTETTSGYTGICEVAPGRLLLVGDKGADWQYPESFEIWGKYIDVTKTKASLESGADAGYVTHIGDNYTAAPYDGNKFLGWYDTQGLVSTNLTENFADTDGTITAKFKNNSIFESPGFELTEPGLVSNSDTSATYPNWHTSADWANVNVVSGAARTRNGSKSLDFFTRYQQDVYTTVSGLRPNTDYTVSYYWMMQEAYTAENNNCYHGMVASSTAYNTISDAYSNRLGSAYGDIYPEVDGAWNKTTFEFNTGDLTTVRLFLSYSGGSNSHLYIDDFTVFKTPEPLTVSLENGTDAGYITNVGNTYTAVSYDGNSFLGWYDAGGLISTNSTQTFEDTDGAIIAKFKNKSIFNSPGFELSSIGSVHYREDSTVNTGWHISADWGTVNVVNSVAHSGSKSLQFFTRYQNDVYTNISGLQPDTNYTVSYYWMMQEAYTAENANCYSGMVASGTAYDTIGEAYQNTIGDTYGAYYPEVGGVWQKDTFQFNTGDLTTVRLFIGYEGGGTSHLYVDDFTVFKTPEPLSVSLESGTDAGYITNDGDIYTAVPYDGNEFLGWYGTKGLISTDPTKNFADAEGAITAKFKNNSIFSTPGFEQATLGLISDVEPSTAYPGWHTGGDWCVVNVVNSVAHSGSKALDFFTRYQQNVYTNVSGLKPNTNYTVSYHWMMKEAYTAQNANCYSGMVASSTAYDTIGEAYQNTIGDTYGAYYPEVGGVWQKDTFQFNTGDLTTVRLFIGYEGGGSSHLYIDDFTVFESPENLYDYDADINSDKFVNNGGSATITEIDTTTADPDILGSKVYSLTTTADFTCGYAADTMALKAGKRYDISFYFKVADGHAMLTSTDSGQYISFFMNSSDGTTRIPIQSAYTLTREQVGGTKITTTAETAEFTIDKTQVVNGQGATVWQRLTASFTPSVDALAIFVVRPNAAGTVYIDQLKVTSAENAADSVQSALSTVGTAIRTSGTQALRFKSEIDKTAISKLYFGTYELVEYGSVAIKTSYLNGQELVLGSYTQADGTTVKNAVKGAAYIKNQCNIVYKDTGSTVQFTAALIGISKANYNTSYSVRTYAVLQRPDSSTFTIYDDDTVSATIYEVAKLAYDATGSNNGYAELPEVRDYLLTNIISKADFETFPGDGFKY